MSEAQGSLKKFMTVAEEIKENSVLNSSEVLSTMKDSTTTQNEPECNETEVDQVEEVEEVAKDLSLEEIKDIISAGTQALALSNYDEAAEKLAIAVEAQ